MFMMYSIHYFLTNIFAILLRGYEGTNVVSCVVVTP